MTDPSRPILAVRLVLLETQIVLGRGEHALGRGVDCAVRIDDSLTSRRHAVIEVSADAVTIRDLGSRNGMIVNGREVAGPARLAEGDLIGIGAQVLEVVGIDRATISQTNLPANAKALGRISIVQRAIREADLAAVTTAQMGAKDAPVACSPDSLRRLAEAANRAAKAGEADRAVAILNASLAEVLRALRAGIDVDQATIDQAVELAFLLASVTRKLRWATYVRELYSATRLPIPAPLAARLEKASKLLT